MPRPKTTRIRLNEKLVIERYGDLMMSACERILKDEIPIDGGYWVESLIELLTAQDARIDELCGELESEFPELLERRFPTDSVLGNKQGTKETLGHWAEENSREGWPRG